MITKKIRKTFLMFLSIAVIVVGCGDMRSPGSDNAETAGGVLRVEEFEHANNVDVARDCCMDFLTHEITECEDWVTDEYMDFEVLWELPAEGTGSATKVTLTSYRVEYFSDDPGAVPLPALDQLNISVVLDPNETVSFRDYLMMLGSTKSEFWDNSLGTSLQPVYEVRVTVIGVNEFGYEVKGRGSTYLVVANYLDIECSAGEVLITP